MIVHDMFQIWVVIIHFKTDEVTFVMKPVSQFMNKNCSQETLFVSQVELVNGYQVTHKEKAFYSSSCMIEINDKLD